MCLVSIMIWQSSWLRCVQKDMVEMCNKTLMNVNYGATLEVCVASKASKVPDGKANRTFWSRV